MKLWAIRVAIWSPAIVLFFYFFGGLVPAIGGASESRTMATSLFQLYSHTCHQIPERSFVIHHAQFGFCARCTGFYGGLALTSLFVVISSRTKAISLVWLISLCIPIILDVILDLSGRFDGANFGRFSTGLISGTAIILFIYPRFINAASKSLAPERHGD